MNQPLKQFLGVLVDSFRDLLPIIVVIAFFELVVLQATPPGLGNILVGTLLVVLGLTFFVYGLQMGLFPLGEALAHAFARKGNVLALLIFAFALGFGTTIAEPALIAVSGEAAAIAAQGDIIANTKAAQSEYATGLRITVALSVGIAIVIGVIRTIKGWPLHFMIAGGYLMVVIMTSLAPDFIIGIAYDSGGVTTSTITVPLVTALGVGLSTSIKGRNPITDGFGLIALASLMPIIFVLAYGMTI